ncbi:autotransporter outer membrane beta-barrel domain-containing protein [Pseudomonas sp. PDNC002]|uniref:autotransporter outer membrane beta-barrel domain-containing protein n=1 Tax=Pseudomonas sp. PDNC002 TaxID=2811422 RepID=UPI001963C186|nr:autotransporter outer membrane beta-barrel domain-containing protein [Pseudomonas sp. PDNC002]QRY77387.1 autotransporter outer membrane beta-barrel domain-containing protein [Pseudomonas sp. PDNC002]
MNDLDRTPPSSTTQSSLMRLRRSHLAQAISLILASVFSLRVIEAEAEDTVTEADTDDLNLPSEAGAVFEPSHPSYLDLALQAAHEVPAVFASRALLGAPPPITVTTTGGIGIATAGVHAEPTIRLAAANATGVKTSGNASISQGRIENSATTAAAAKGQTGAHVSAGDTLTISDSSIVLDPKTTASVAITTNDLTGVRVDANGTAQLSDTQVLIGGGAKGNNNRGIVVTHGQLDMHRGSVGTQSWGAAGVTLENGAQARLDEVAVTTIGARSTATGGAHGVLVTGASSLAATGGTIDTTGGSAYGLRVDSGSSADLHGTAITTAGGNGHGVLVDAAGATLDGGSVTTSGKGSVGVWARNGATVNLTGDTRIHTSGAAVSAATPVDDEKVLSLSHGLLAGGAGTVIDADGVILDIAAGSASAARGEEGAQITLNDADITVSGSATSTATTAALHALSGSHIDLSNSTLDVSGTNVGGARAEGSGSHILLSHSSANVSGAGNVANPAAGARAMDGASVALDHATLQVHGLTYGHGVSIEGSGSSGDIRHSTVSVDGNRSIGLNITGGATATVDASSLSVDAPPGAVGPWSPGVLVDGAGSALRMTGSDVRTTPKTSYGVQVREGADAVVSNGSITTHGNYSTALAAGSSSSAAPASTLTASNLTVTTHGNDNAMGIVADLGATVIVHGGSVTTTGNGSPVASHLTFPHALAARNPGALLVADGTSVLTQGAQAYGAAVDDGGRMQLDNLSVKTEGSYSVGLYAGIGSAKPGAVGLTASHVSVQTSGDHAAGAMVSRHYKSETATLDLSDSSIATLGASSHGLRAESGGALSATNSTVSTQGEQAVGVFANNTATAHLDGVSVNSQGSLGHGVVARQGGSVDAESVVVAAHGAQSAALYVQGTDALPGQVRMDRATLSNRDGATIATAGVADIALSHSLAGGSGQWLNVDRSVASDGSAIPDMGTGQWQGIGTSQDAAGNARLDLSSSLVSGTAKTAAGSQSDVTLRDTSLWQLTGDSNLSSLRNDASLVDFSAEGGYKRLTVNEYHGANGTLALNTYLYKDDSPSDQLVIDGGQATGESNLRIKNAGGPGALTEGNGIKVVDAVNGGTTEAEAFRLLNRVKAGPYEYTLHRASLDDSNSEAWYLRSTKDTPPVDPVDPVDPKDPSDPVDPAPHITPDDPTPPRQVPNYRAETSLYSALPAMALNYSRALVDTLHERVGEERRNDTDPLPSEDTDTYGPSLGWGRVIHQKGKDSLPGGADYDYRIQAFQVGADLYRNEDTDGSTDQAGLSLQAGRIKGSVDHTDGQGAGDDTLRSYGIGGYWTHFGPKGWYLDGVLQFNRFDMKAHTNDADSLKTRGHGITASLEAGYPFKVNRDKTLHVEPQAQLIASRLKLDDAHDDAADVRFEDVDSLTGRLGVRIDKDWFREDDEGRLHRTNVWVRPSVWHEFEGKAKTEFSSANGYIPFGTDMNGTWGELNLGVDYQLNDRTSVTGSLGYQKSFDGEGRSYEGILGIKVKF